ncbi:MAG: RAQPRD family integrative conjugative element protein [Gammaproteobacteria bacterium]|nr:RAQPRD family integrative conjugative element protein [Gammaproteobacteria bacterium]
MRMTKTLILFVAALSPPTYAVTDQERSVLYRLNTELEAITTIIDEAQQAANPHARNLVDYHRLRADLKQISQGVVDAANAVRREPRSLPPIDGDYR